MPDSPLNDEISQEPQAPSSNAQLAALLADALRDAESLRRELAVTKKRADDIERRYHALASLSDPKSSHADSSRVIQEFEQRALDAEAARDDAESRRRLVLETWHQLDRYLQTVEIRAADARAGFSKIAAEGGGHVVFNAIPVPGGGPVSIPYPSLGTMPPPNHARTPYPSTGRPSPLGHRSAQSQSSFPPLALPPHPVPNTNGRRPRDESLDGTGYVDSLPGQPPSKKLKGFGDDRRGRDERTAYSESSLAYMHQRHQPLPPQTIEARERIYQERRLPQARMIVPPTGGGDPELANHRGRSRSRSRSSSRSSRSSLSVDEMLLEAANGNGAPGSAGDTASQRSHRRRHHNSHKEDPTAGNQRHPITNEPTLHTIQQPQPQPLPPSQRMHADSPPPQQLVHNYRARAPLASASVPLVTENHVGTIPATCHVQTIQTHVFAPVVTGAPQKKNKFSASSSVGNLGTNGSGDAPPPTPQHVYPPINNQGQRICRQCGMPGRYKEGKCVEKWGPGPMGPGTVCDRCRKKMKRVERRGNLESQQLSASNSVNTVGPHQQHSQPHQQHQQHVHGHGHGGHTQQPQQTQPVPPRNAVLQSVPSDRGVHRTDTLVNTNSNTVRVQAQGQGLNQNSGQGAPGVRERDKDDLSDARSALVAAVASSGGNGGGGGGGAQLVHKSGNGRVAMSPPPIASINDELPISNVGRGGAGSRVHSRPSSRNDRPAGIGIGIGAVPSKRSPLSAVGNGSQASISPSQIDVDADADADADAEADADPEGETEGGGGGGGDGDGEGDGEGEGEENEIEDGVDPDADVDAEIEGALEAAARLETETDPDDEIFEAAGGKR